MKVHRVLGPGFLESVYKNALAIELRARGLLVEREVPCKVDYEGVIVGDFSADMYVERCVMVESKAVRMLLEKHEAQTVNYLNATRIDIGLLLNFGCARLEVRRKFRVYKPASTFDGDASDRSKADEGRDDTREANGGEADRRKQDGQDEDNANG